MKLIDKDAAIELTWEEPSYTDPLNVLTEVRDRIKELPTIDAVPVRHGRWIPKTIVIGGTEFPYGSICSICGEDAINAEGDDFLTDYCPNCGARMDEE